MTINWGECYYDHYSKFLGDPIGREMFTQADDQPLIQVLFYERGISGCLSFCSLGLTHYKGQIGSICEVFLPIDEAWETVPTLLANALFYIVQNSLEFGWGMAVGGLESIAPNFAHEFSKAALYITLPPEIVMPEDFVRVSCGDSQGLTYIAFFISPAEYAYFQEHGAKMFEQLLKQKQVDPFELRRPSCI